MRPLVVALGHVLVATLLLLPAAPSRAVAQETWNDARTNALVRDAIRRRTVQLADTGLTDYTARAHGYLTFLAQVGEGFPDAPTLIKSDELVVEVYWAAPDRSKQRVVGRRDTLLLPTDINYHRDHLGIVQNNFPAIIRLGEGDEVADVPHPLSIAGLGAYDYRIADSLAIRTSDRAIDVMMVKVRPKDDRSAAAVGAVYIDRVTGSVVRMALSFTRAALLDPQLEDVSVILENGLVEGRFWLPRRQEIEIRRSATWMDFPARGIIRGRWEICCVEANVGLPPTTFVGPEITQAPRAQLRQWPFEGTILENLPEEVRELDADEVRAVQDEARELVRAGALARARSTSASARRVSDILQVNRAEGLAVGGGLTRRLGAGFTATVGARYGTADDDFKPRARVEWEAVSGLRVTAGYFDDFAQAGDAPEVSGLRNSIAAQEFGSDWTDPYGVRGGFLRVEQPASRPVRFWMELTREDQRPLRVRARPTNGRYAPLLAADSAEVWRMTIGLSTTSGPRTPDTRVSWRLDARVSGSSVDRPSFPETTSHLRASLDAEGTLAAGAAGRLVWRTIAAGTARGAVPAQDLVHFGGPVSGPGYAFHSLSARTGVSQRLEWRVRIPFVHLDLGRFGRVPSTLTIAPYLHGVWLEGGGASGSRGTWFPSVGIGAIGLFDLLRVDVARTIEGGRWMFSLDLDRGFWPVL
ncbi:MAG TPA: hypothetical protein VFM71_10795 [Gemmatimonadaceae bacterium]|nr:hypothetical protein [Gemmatimonadaceae bacterium]